MKRILLLLLILPILAIGQVPDPLPNTYVNDLATVLKPDQIRALNEKILSIEKKSSVQIAVVLINALPDNMEIDQYALAVGRKWHVGNANNGLVYVAAISQKKQRLEVASNLEGDIPDITALEITDKIKPFFRNRDYYGGINELLEGISKRVDPVVKEQLKLAAAEREKKDEKMWQGVMTFIMWMLGLVLLFVFVRFVILRNYFKSKREAKEVKEAKEMQSNFPTPLAAAAAGGGLLAGIGTSIAMRNYRPTYNSDDVSKSTPSNNDDSSSSSSSSSGSSNDSNYGNWGSDSSSSDSSSGFSGGGASNDW